MCVASRAFGRERSSTGGKVVIELVDCMTENKGEHFCKCPRAESNAMSIENKEYAHSSYEGSHRAVNVISSLTFHTLAR